MPKTCAQRCVDCRLTAVGTFHTEKHFNISNIHNCTTSITVKA